MKLIPKRRFRGYRENWEKINVDEIGEDFYGGGTPKTSEESYWAGDIPWIQSSDLDEKLYLDKFPKNKITNSGLENSATRLVPSNSIAIVTRVGVGKLSLIPYDFTTSQDFFSISKLKVNPLFGVYVLYRLLQKEKEMVQGTSIKGLTKEDLLKKKVIITNYVNEQRKIGQFFKHLDDMIALHQKKIEKTKALKSAYLAEMFPAEGESVPKRRFAGFTEEWEKSRLDDVAIYRRGSFPQPYGNEDWYDEEEGLPFVQVVDVGKNLKLVDNTKQKISILAQPHSVFVEKGKVLVTLQGSIGRVAITQYPSFVDRTILIFESYKLDVNKAYFAYIIQLLFEKEKLKAPGGTIKTITKEALSEFVILIPNIKEQKKIGGFFNKIDNIITTHEQKLDKLKATKQAYLNEMFV